MREILAAGRWSWVLTWKWCRKFGLHREVLLKFFLVFWEVSVKIWLAQKLLVKIWVGLRSFCQNKNINNWSYHSECSCHRNESRPWPNVEGAPWSKYSGNTWKFQIIAHMIFNCEQKLAQVFKDSTCQGFPVGRHFWAWDKISEVWTSMSDFPFWVFQQIRRRRRSQGMPASLGKAYLILEWSIEVSIPWLFSTFDVLIVGKYNEGLLWLKSRWAVQVNSNLGGLPSLI